jgi:hypothetical protein
LLEPDTKHVQLSFFFGREHAHKYIGFYIRNLARDIHYVEVLMQAT